MTPAARLSAAIEVLDRWLSGAGRAERLLRDWGKANRYAGSGDRRAISDIVYDCLRRRRSLAWSNGAGGGRGLVLGLALAEGWDVPALFSDARFAPAPVSAKEMTGPSAPPPDAVAHDHPDWLEPLLKQSLGGQYSHAMKALTARAPLDLRVNRLKADRAAAEAALRADGIETAPLTLDPDALRCLPGARVMASRAWRDGLVEVQDVAAQAAARLAAAKGGEIVLDYCAGGGGKALALAAHMGGEGRVIAHDIAPARMKDLPSRAARAGAMVEIMPTAALTTLEGACDLVFVDAPCSGSGTWRREPEAKWHLTPERLSDLCAAQVEAIRNAARFVKPGGRLAYATCSFLNAENEDQTRHIAASLPHARAIGKLRLIPGEGADGFYCEVFQAGNF